MRARAAAALLALAACASDETACEEGDSTRCLAVTAGMASRDAAGWPERTPGLREVVLDVRAFGADAAIAGADGRGVMVLARDLPAEATAEDEGGLPPSEAVALVFDNGEPRRYRLPPGRFRLIGFGDSHLCRGGGFTVAPQGPTPEIFVTARADGRDVTGPLAVEILQGRSSPDALPGVAESASCLTEAGWEGTVDEWSTLSTVVIVAGLVVLIPLLAIAGDSFIIVTGF